jgi:hypothetical protein
MTHKPPAPVCKALLVCHRIVVEKSGEVSLLGITTSHQYHHFPCATQAGIFARLSSARGAY